LGRGRHDQGTSRDGEQLKRLEPDYECALADSVEQRLADPPPVVLIGGRGEGEATPNLRELDSHRPPPLATALADVGLLDEDRVTADPPLRGKGG
jgi:hypothetical protein